MIEHGKIHKDLIRNAFKNFSEAYVESKIECDNIVNQLKNTIVKKKVWGQKPVTAWDKFVANGFADYALVNNYPNVELWLFGKQKLDIITFAMLRCNNDTSDYVLCDNETITLIEKWSVVDD